jgi:hypothetical protein
MEGDVNVEADSPPTDEWQKKGCDHDTEHMTEEQQEPEFDDLTYIQKGMTMKMVVNIVGRPHEIKNTSSAIKWQWDEGTVDYEICVDSSPWRNKCWLRFDKETKRVISQVNMNTNYLDIYSEW